MRRQRPVLVVQQVVNVFAGVDAHQQDRHKPRYVVQASVGRRYGFAHLPCRERIPAGRIGVFELVLHGFPGVTRPHQLANPVVLGPVHAGDRPVGAVDALELLDVVLGAKKQPRVAVDPGVHLRTHQQHGTLLDGRRLERHHGAVLAVEIGEVACDVALQQVPVQEIAQGDRGNRPRCDATSGGLQGHIALAHRLLDDPAHHFQVADEGDTLAGGLQLFRLQHETEGLAGIEQPD